MKISLSASGILAKELEKTLYPFAKIYSFRKLKDNQILDILKDSDVLIHNAANTNFNSNTLIYDNFYLTKRIVDLIYNNNLPILMINIGSMSYLKNENSYKDKNEMSLYALSKYYSEIYALSFIENLKCIRFSNIFYKNPQKDTLSKIICDAKRYEIIRVLNNGKAKRDWISINIASEYLKKCIETPTNKIINISSGNEISFFEIANIINKYIPCEIRNTIANEDNSIISKFTNKLPKIEFSLEKEIKEFICEL